MAFDNQLGEANRLTTSNYFIDASMSVIVAYDYEMGLNQATEIGLLALLEII